MSARRRSARGGAIGRRDGVSRWVAAATTITALAAAMALAAPAVAAPRPSVSTGGAREVGFGSAVLTGSVNPNGRETSYYFQYGVNRNYSLGQTTIANAGAGTHGLKVSVPVSGLQPLTTYHYRLVAVNGAGASSGDDKTFLTTKVPLALQIVATPDPVLFGGPVIVQGALSGTGNANRVVVLQANTFPFSAGFQNVNLNPVVTKADGSFSFALFGLTQVTQFRVVTTMNLPVVSPVVLENVAVSVVAHVARAKRRHFVRIFGTVTPAEDRMPVGVLRYRHGSTVLVGGTILRHRNASSSQFSRVVRARRGVYRVFVQITSGAQVSSYSQPLVIH